MSIANKLTVGLIGTTFALCALSNPTHERRKELDEEGLFKEPICSTRSGILRGMTIFLQEESTGLKASNDKWDMEIYADKDNQSWSLVGKSKAPGTASYHLCKIANGVRTPYTEQPWFKKYFQSNQTIKAPAPTPGT